jgi:hypothetical protein
LRALSTKKELSEQMRHLARCVASRTSAGEVDKTFLFLMGFIP